MRPWLWALAAAVLLAVAAGCARPSSAAAGPPGALRASDLPRGLVRCPGSGDMAAYLAELRASSPGAFEATAHGWAAAQDQGALSATVALYADRVADCALLHDVGADPGGRPRLAFGLAYRFASAERAAAAYQASALGAVAGERAETRSGAATGLGGNATTISRTDGDRTYFLAFWQRGAYALDFFAINLDPAATERAVHLLDVRAAQQPRM